mgnify:CR=1 FL=1
MRLHCFLLSILAAGFSALAAAAPDYTLHEWGTFTSISGSDGTLLPGLEREEEALPMFVKSHDGMRPQFTGGKGWQRPLHNVTIKMETPVIYFYASQPFAAHVKVGFNGGSISQWFPDRSRGETPPPYTKNPQFMPAAGDIDFAKGYQGDIEWEVQVQPPSVGDGAAVFKAGETLTWVYPRQTDAAVVRTKDGAAEKFLFYRGVGNFALPVRFTLPDDGTLRIENKSSAAVPAVLIFNHGVDGKVSFTMLGSTKAGETRAVPLTESSATTNWQLEVYRAMSKALVEAGLFQKEADAMLQTWWSSYFQRPGLRAFWIVPENFTTEILPLAVHPAPRKQVRVLVGRSELLTPKFEQELVVEFSKKEQNRWQYDRYFPAYAARVNTLKPKLATSR